jgi:hypothetical protein
MMKFTSRLGKYSETLCAPLGYASLLWHESKMLPGVSFAVRRISLANRLELTRQMRELTLRYEFLRAGDQSDQLEAALSDLLVRRLYLEWGLASIKGFSIDGELATIELLIEKGPEELAGEIISVIRQEIELSEEERKNS